MALVKFPEGQQRSGKQGGMVWSRNRFGAYARNRAIPVNPDSVLQRDVRSQLAALSKSWQDLSDNQRSAWTAAAQNFPKINRLGDSYVSTGFNYYVQINQVLYSAFASQISSPYSNSPIPFPSIPITEFQINGSDIFLDLGLLDEFEVPEGFCLQIQATRPCSEGKNTGSVKSAYYAIKQFNAGSTITSGTTNIFDEYEAKFGSIPAGSTAFFKARMVSTLSGQDSSYSTYKGVII